MEFLELVKETKKLDEDIKRQRREFNLKIEEKVKTHKSKKKEIERYLEETINSREYEYREVEVESFSMFGKTKGTTYYPFLKLDDIYEVKGESFKDYDENYDDYGLYREYTLYNKDNEMEVKVKEHSVIRLYKKGTNEEWIRHYNFGEKLIRAARHFSYKIEIEGMKFEFRRSFDVSKL